MSKIVSFLYKKIFYFKISAVMFMSIVAFFVGKDNPWHHWSWLLYGSLAIILIIAEIIDKRENEKQPLDKFRVFLSEHTSWKSDGESIYHYKPDPAFTIRIVDDNQNLDFDQEWTRGEIGSHYNTGNCAYYARLYYYEVLIEKVHIVRFDGGKKTIVAPDWSAVNSGRIYYYLRDSIKYAYQQYLAELCGKDYSKSLNKCKGGTFKIPIFENSKELKDFCAYCGNTVSERPSSDKDEQNNIFYQLIDKYRKFKQKEANIPVGG